MELMLKEDYLTMSSADLLEMWLQDKSEKTQFFYRDNLKKFIKFTEGKTINPTLLLEYKKSLLQKNLKPNTINTYLAPVKEFCSWLYKAKQIDFDPSTIITRVKLGDTNNLDKARAVSESELKKLFNATSKETDIQFRDRILLLLLFNLGLRDEEVRSLRVNSFDFFNETVSVLGKGKKRRKLGLNDVLMNELSEYFLRLKLSDDDYVIKSFGRHKSKDLRVSANFGHRTIKKYCELAGIDHIKTHSGRVTLITMLLDSGQMMRDVANFAGHDCISTTRKYDRGNEAKNIQISKIIQIGGETLKNNLK